MFIENHGPVDKLHSYFGIVISVTGNTLGSYKPASVIFMCSERKAG